MLAVRCTQRKVPVDVSLLRRQLACAVDVIRGAPETPLRLGAALAGDVGVWLAGDATVRALNARYRGVRRVTDVLAFPSGIEEGDAAAAAAAALGGAGGQSEALDLGTVVVAPAFVQRRLARQREWRRASTTTTKTAATAAATTAGEQQALVVPPSLLALEERLRVSLPAHVAAVSVHGICHLFGHRHDTGADYDRMLSVERQALRSIAPLLEACHQSIL